MHTLLDSWSQKEKDTLIKYGVDNTETGMEFYHNLLKSGVEEDIFDYERQIFDNLTKKRRNNILEYLTSFDDGEYAMDDDVGYPNDERGESEYWQQQTQEKQGYSDDMIDAIKRFWTNGFYEDIQNYIRNKTVYENYPDSIQEGIKHSANTLLDYIENSVGLDESTVLFRGGHWDIGTQVGDVKSIPLLNSTSYSKDTANALGLESEDNPNRYMITVYAPKGTKGCMVNAPSLSHTFPEHEYLLNKGQKYIVLDVNDNDKTASILLINE